VSPECAQALQVLLSDAMLRVDTARAGAIF
jgi:hypothetical protein